MIEAAERPAVTPGPAVAVIAAVAALSELAALGYALLSPALRAVGTQFHTAQVAWVVTAYSAAGAVGAPVLGSVGDRFGRRRALLGAALASALGATVAAGAGSFPVLIVGRAVEGLGLALVPLGLALLRDVLPARLVPTGVGVVTTGFGLVAIGGRFLAGYLVDAHGWRSVLWFLAVLPVALVGVVALVVPTAPGRPGRRIDWIGAALLGGGVAAMLIGVANGTAWHWESVRTMAALVGGAVLLAGWWSWEQVVDQPLIHLDVLRSGVVLAAVGAGCCFEVATSAVSSLVPLMVQTPSGRGGDYGFGASVLGTSRYTVWGGICTVLAGFLFGSLHRRVGAGLPLATGCAAVGLGAVLLGYRMADPGWVGIGVAAVGAGAGCCYAGVSALVIGATPPTELGVALGTSSAVQALGAAIGVQLIFATVAGHVVITATAGPTVYTVWGYRLGFLICAGFAVVAGLVATTTLRRHRGRPTSD